MEEVMAQQPQPIPVPADEPPPHPAEPLQIETPVIDMQDLEHKPAPDTRVSNKGVKIEPTLDSSEQRGFALGDDAVLEALEELESRFFQEQPGR
jgi:hypothetical protein